MKTQRRGARHEGEKFLLFPDTNLLLGFYQGDPLELVDDLLALGSSVFITKQVRDEVERRKASVADELMKQMREPQRGPATPWLEGFAEFDRSFEQHRRAWKELQVRMASWQVAVAKSEDAASNALRALLQVARIETEEQFMRAHQRRERGNPPGKSKGTLGDQISWEQILAAVGPQTRHVWIVSRDQDYGRAGTLDPMLRGELRHLAPNAEVTLTDDLAASVNACLDALGEEHRVSEAARREYEERQEQRKSELATVGLHALNGIGVLGVAAMLMNPTSRDSALEMLEGPAYRQWLELLNTYPPAGPSDERLGDALQRAVTQARNAGRNK